MKKNHVIISVFFLGLLAIGSFIVLFLIFNSLEKEVGTKPTPEILVFMKGHPINFSHPYISCIFNKTCNGTFELSLSSDIDNDISTLENFLNLYGEMRSVNILNGFYSIDFETDNLYKIDPLLKSSFFNSISLLRVRSDYKSGISDADLHSCFQDEDCVIVNEGDCIPSPDIINKKYQDEIESLFAISHQGEICPAFWSSNIYQFSIAKCDNKICNYRLNETSLCGIFYSDCKHVTKEYENASILLYSDLSCKDVIDLCKDF